MRKMPVRLLRVELEDDFEGWWFDAMQDPPLAFLEMMGAFAGRNTVRDDEVGALSTATIDGLMMVVRLWNFVDEQGKKLKLSRNNIALLPGNLQKAMVGRYIDELQPEAGERNGSQSGEPSAQVEAPR